MKSPRIVHVLGTAAGEGTGILRVVESIVTGAAERGYESEYWFLGDRGVLLEALVGRGQRALALGWSGSKDQLLQVLRFAARLLATRPMLVCQHGGGRTIGRIAKMSGARVVRHIHAYTSAPDDGGAVAIASAEADAVIANSRATALRVRAPRIEVIYPGTDAGIALAYRPAAQAPGAFVVGAASRLTTVKGIDVLIEAVARLSSEFPSVQLQIAGSGPERDRLEAVAQDLGVRERVAFLGWREDLSDLFGGWDVFVQPSRAEGFGLAALDAMTAGVPVVASAVGGLVELIEHGRTGWLAPADDAGALAAAIGDALRDHVRRRAVGEAGRRRAAKHFSRRRMVEATLAVYADLLTRGTG